MQIQAPSLLFMSKDSTVMIRFWAWLISIFNILPVFFIKFVSTVYRTQSNLLNESIKGY